MTAAPRLEYAPGAPLRRRKRIRRAVLLVVLIASIIAAWRYGPRFRHRAALLYAQHRCLTYTAASDLIVYEGKQPDAVALLAKPGYVALPLYGEGISVTGQVAAYVPPAYADFERTAFGNVSGRSAVLFMHELRDKSGRRRLVIVARDSQAFWPIFTPFNLMATVWEPATFTTDPAVVPMKNPKIWDYNGPGYHLPAKDLRFYAGQLDPADPGHFTIRYELEGRPGLVDGRLNETGDDVVFQITSGPAAPPSPWSNVYPPSAILSPSPGN